MKEVIVEMVIIWEVVEPMTAKEKQATRYVTIGKVETLIEEIAAIFYVLIIEETSKLVNAVAFRIALVPLAIDVMTFVEQVLKKENALTMRRETANEETIADFHMTPATELVGGLVCGIGVATVGI